jgi:hypothetical protein
VGRVFNDQILATAILDRLLVTPYCQHQAGELSPPARRKRPACSADRAGPPTTQITSVLSRQLSSALTFFSEIW